MGSRVGFGELSLCSVLQRAPGCLTRLGFSPIKLGRSVRDCMTMKGRCFFQSKEFLSISPFIWRPDWWRCRGLGCYCRIVPGIYFSWVPLICEVFCAWSCGGIYKISDRDPYPSWVDGIVMLSFGLFVHLGSAYV